MIHCQPSLTQSSLEREREMDIEKEGEREMDREKEGEREREQETGNEVVTSLIFMC